MSSNAGVVGRRSAVIAASSGLMVTMGLPAAGATPLGHPTPEASPDATAAQAALDGEVSAPQAAQVTFALPAVTTVDDAAHRHDSQVEAAEDAAVPSPRSSPEAAAPSTPTPTASGTPSPSASSSASAAPTQAARTASATATPSQTAAPTPSRTASAAPSSSAPSSSAPSSSAPATAAAQRLSAPKTVAASASGAAAVDLARRYIGIPYRYGGTTPSGFDCSGFVQYVYAQLGVDLPRTAAQQSQAGTRVSADDAQPGDIVSFYSSGGVYHNGIYIGGGKMINSPRTGKLLQEQDIWSSAVVFTRVAA